MSSRSALNAARATLETAFLSSLLALPLGVAMAFALGVTDMRGRRLVSFLFVLSVMISPQVMALAFLHLAGPASPILNTLGLAPEAGSANPMLGRGGIVLVMGLHHAPLVYVVMSAGLKRIPSAVVEAARIDGAHPMRIVTDHLLPLLRPHLVSAALLAFVAGIGNFGIPALLGAPVNYLTLPVLIYRRLSSFGTEHPRRCGGARPSRRRHRHRLRRGEPVPDAQEQRASRGGRAAAAVLASRPPARARPRSSSASSSA